MRTTLDIDDDVLRAAKARAKSERRSTGAVLSELARSALAAPALPPESDESESFCGFRPLPSRGGIVTNELIDRLREDDVC